MYGKSNLEIGIAWEFLDQKISNKSLNILILLIRNVTVKQWKLACYTTDNNSQRLFSRNYLEAHCGTFRHNEFIYLIILTNIKLIFLLLFFLFSGSLDPAAKSASLTSCCTKEQRRKLQLSRNNTTLRTIKWAEGNNQRKKV